MNSHMALAIGAFTSIIVLALASRMRPSQGKHGCCYGLLDRMHLADGSDQLNGREEGEE